MLSLERIRQMHDKRMLRSTAIRLKCVDCCAYESKEVRLCPVVSCPLWEFRFGRGPTPEESRLAWAARLDFCDRQEAASRKGTERRREEQPV